MPTPLDKKLVPATLKMIQRFGRNMDFTNPRTDSYDPATGEGKEEIHRTLTAKASPPIDYEQRYIDGETIKRGDARIFLAASELAFTPERDMHVKIDNAEFKVLNVLPLHSGEQIAAYEVQLRS